VPAVKQRWLRLMPGGRRPPLTKTSDDEVIDFVATEPGGIGYVSASAHLPAGVSQVLLE
jgi:hypothetical protein